MLPDDKDAAWNARECPNPTRAAFRYLLSQASLRGGQLPAGALSGVASWRRCQLVASWLGVTGSRLLVLRVGRYTPKWASVLSMTAD